MRCAPSCAKPVRSRVVQPAMPKLGGEALKLFREAISLNPNAGVKKRSPGWRVSLRS